MSVARPRRCKGCKGRDVTEPMTLDLARVLVYVAWHRRQRGHPPSWRTIARQLFASDVPRVRDLLYGARRAGFVSFTAERHSLTVTPRGATAAAALLKQTAALSSGGGEGVRCG